jgi:hypothetical protein
MADLRCFFEKNDLCPLGVKFIFHVTFEELLDVAMLLKLPKVEG